ncbi:hypothetical protein [Desulfuribacillus stibiiarsenatis]|uniref:hypothetical protein n=1 Tax=Desulfuribacillus stibiiarsenatis TaxID=1390249 RepID=UPI00159F2405|nr:hypothetical protein [Desulfuribacillus stibiiarsenatis]
MYISKVRELLIILKRVGPLLTKDEIIAISTILFGVLCRLEADYEPDEKEK